eukprot:10058728-Lingulodinium_polyedra.AAC.1
MLGSDVATLDLYADDPILLVQGPSVFARHTAARVALVWEVFGLCLIPAIVIGAGSKADLGRVQHMAVQR